MRPSMKNTSLNTSPWRNLSAPGESSATAHRRTPLARRRLFGPNSGMTLVEVVVGVGILITAVLVTLGFIMRLVAQNRQTAMDIAGLQAVNQMAGEIEELVDATPSGEVIAHSIVKHFKELPAENLDIGPFNKSSNSYATLPRVEDDNVNGCLVYRFWVPAPGDSRYLETDSRFKKNHRAVGEMRIFLNETILNNDFLTGFSWTDLSKTPLTTSGMDLDLNGSLNDNLLHSYDDVKQLAIMIDVVYYTDESHQTEAYRTWRNIMVTKIRDATKNIDPTKPGG